MTKADIPASVAQFILQRIDTVSQLEALLIMSADEARDWSVEDIASRVYVAAPSAAAVLHSLHQQRLVDTNDGGVHYRFSPASDDERKIVRQTADAYRSYLIPIATLIHRKASNPVQEFARAFSLKKDS